MNETMFTPGRQQARLVIICSCTLLLCECSRARAILALEHHIIITVNFCPNISHRVINKLLGTVIEQLLIQPDLSVLQLSAIK